MKMNTMKRKNGRSKCTYDGPIESQCVYARIFFPLRAFLSVGFCVSYYFIVVFFLFNITNTSEGKTKCGISNTMNVKKEKRKKILLLLPLLPLPPSPPSIFMILWFGDIHHLMFVASFYRVHSSFIVSISFYCSTHLVSPCSLRFLLASVVISLPFYL